MSFHTLPALLVVVVLAVLPGGDAFGQGRRRRPSKVEVSDVARDAALAAAADLTAAQARTVFAQILQPPHAPRIRSILAETRPDGTRNVFGLLEVDRELECRFEGTYTARECHEEESGHVVHLFLTQVAADGRIARTAITLPFDGASRAHPQSMRPVALRLFAPTPGAASVALVDGISLSRRFYDDVEGYFVPPSYEHGAYVWDGRRGMRFNISTVSRGNDPGSHSEGVATLRVDEAGRRLVVSEVSCEGDCPCSMPTTVEREAATFTRLAARGGACAPREHAFSLAPDLHLVDDDLEARTPHRTRADAVAARAPELERAARITRAQADAILAAQTVYPIAFRLGPFLSHVGGDGTKEVYGVVGRNELESCAFARPTSMYDAVRACAHETGVEQYVLYARFAPDGGLAGSGFHGLGEREIGALYLAPSGDRVDAAVDSWSVVRSPADDQLWYQHEVTFVHGAHGSSRPIGRLGNAPRDRRRSDQYVGELVARLAQGTLQSLVLRKAVCSERCACDPFPASPPAERAVIAARANATDEQCRVEDVRLVPP